MRDNIGLLFDHKEIHNRDWVIWDGEKYSTVSQKPIQRRENRETLARVFMSCTEQIEQLRSASFEQASRMVRSLWIEESEPRRPKSLPRIVGEDGFLRMYALGQPLSVELFRKIWRRLGEPLEDKTIELEPFYVEWNDPEVQFHDINATPPGFLPKISSYFRLKKDKQLLRLVASDLAHVSRYESAQKRKVLSVALLSHGAAYRELDGQVLWISSFREKNKLLAYRCKQHLIAEGVKTISLVPQTPGAPPLYICQGTELWPSQPSVLGSILANFATHGSATEAYAHSWRRIQQTSKRIKWETHCGRAQHGRSLSDTDWALLTHVD